MEQFLLPRDNDEWKHDATRKRDSDVQDWDNLPKIYAKKSARTSAPANSADITSAETLGDILVLPNFLYVVVQNGANLKWQRVALADF